MEKVRLKTAFFFAALQMSLGLHYAGIPGCVTIAKTKKESLCWSVPAQAL
jgi:hypothetical protein